MYMHVCIYIHVCVYVYMRVCVQIIAEKYQLDTELDKTKAELEKATNNLQLYDLQLVQV